MKPLRVLYIRSCRGITEVTGAEIYLLTLLQQLNPQEYESLLVCITDPQRGDTPWLQELKRRGLPFVRVPVGRWLSLRDLFTIPLWIRRFQADIVHTQDHRADVVGIIGSKFTGRPVIATCHGWIWPADSLRGKVYPWLDRQVLKRADATVAVSAAMAAQLNLGTAGPPLVVIPNGVDTNKFHPVQGQSALKSRFFADEDVVIIGMVARVHPDKGQLDFLKAAAQLSRSYPNCRFLLVGHAPPGCEAYKQEVLRFIVENGLERVVKVTNVPPSQVPTLLAAIDIYVAPSYAEGLSFSLLEAMAMEKPIVATHVGGNPEVIVDGETGVLIPPGDADTLRRVVATLIDDPGRRAHLGRQARQKVMRDFSVEAMVSQTTAVYQELAIWRQQNQRSTRQLRERLEKIATS